jgi:hypothetical protein
VLSRLRLLFRNWTVWAKRREVIELLFRSWTVWAKRQEVVEFQQNWVRRWTILRSEDLPLTYISVLKMSLVQRSPTRCGVSEYDREASIMGGSGH